MEMRRFWDFLNSKLILLLLGFLLTTIVGSYLTGKFQLEFHEVTEFCFRIVGVQLTEIAGHLNRIRTWTYSDDPVAIQLQDATRDETETQYGQ